MSRQRRFRPLVFAVAFTLLAGACGGGAQSSETMHLRLLDGSARLLRDDRSQIIRSGTGVAPGDRIIMEAGASANLRLAAGRTFELLGSDVVIESESVLLLRRGNLLAELTAPAEVSIENSRVRAEQGALRVDRALASRVAVYKGNAVLSGDGDRLEVPQLRQAIVAGGIIPSVPSPIRITSSDRWDRRYLEPVLDLDARLTNFGRGLEAQLGQATGLEFFSAVVPTGLDIGFLSEYLSQRRSDLLIGVMIAIQSSRSSVPLDQRFSQIFEMWINDASWGLIAYEFGVGEVGLFTVLLDAIGRAGLIVVGPGGGPGLRRRPPARGNGGSQPSPSPDRTQTTSSPSPSPGVPLPEPIDSAVPDPEQSVVDGVVCGLLGSTACSPSP